MMFQPVKKQGYRILRYDMYGRGYSDQPNIVHNQQLYRRQLLELVEKLDLGKPFDLIGLSLGGGIATDFTYHHPEKVRKLVLISPLIRSLIPNIEFKPVDGIGHGILFQHTGIVNNLIVDFLTSAK